MKKLLNLLSLTLAISGFVPGNATILRTIVMTFTFFFSIHLANSNSLNPVLAIWFFLFSTIAYIGFLYAVLPEKGLRHWFMKSFGGEKQGYLAYEAVLAFLFFVNGAGIGYVSVAFENTLPFMPSAEIVRPIAVLLFAAGWIIKIWAAKVVGVDIYYWKDMFFGRTVGPFVEAGPYKFTSNPMYGLGQLQSYATALWYLSLPGLVAAALYQLAVFSFYFLQEKKFIERVYLKKTYSHGA